jgi:hypothetical protein
MSRKPSPPVVPPVSSATIIPLSAERIAAHAKKHEVPAPAEPKTQAAELWVQPGADDQTKEEILASSEALVPREEFDKLLSDLQKTYQPSGAEEALLVEQLAALWFRLAQVHRAREREYHEQKHIKGVPPVEVLATKRYATFSAEETRVERGISRLRRKLVQMQRMRIDGVSPSL